MYRTIHRLGAIVAAALVWVGVVAGELLLQFLARVLTQGQQTQRPTLQGRAGACGLLRRFVHASSDSTASGSKLMPISVRILFSISCARSGSAT